MKEKRKRGYETGPTSARFPTTRWTMVRDAGDRDSPTYKDSLELLAHTYWRPVFAYFLRKWGRGREEAKDMTQEFFLGMFDKNFLERLSPEHSRFRAYVRTALDNHAREQYRKSQRKKRGGGLAHFSLGDVEGYEPSAGATPDEVFEREWARVLLEEALKEVEEEYRKKEMDNAFEILMLRDLDPPVDGDVSYKALAQRFDLNVGDVTNLLHRARKKLREALLRKVRDTVSSNAEAEAELKTLFRRMDT